MILPLFLVLFSQLRLRTSTGIRTVKDVKMFAEAESKPSIIRRLMRPFKSRVSLLRKVQELRDKLSELLVRFNVNFLILQKISEKLTWIFKQGSHWLQ